MNRINPIQIVALLIVLLVFIIFKLNILKSEFNELRESYSSTVVLAKDLRKLKRSYFNEERVEKSISKLLRKSLLRDAHIHKKITNSSIVLSSDGMNIRSLNFLMSRILNSKYIVSELRIKQISSEKASLKMEIKW